MVAELLSFVIDLQIQFNINYQYYRHEVSI